MSTTTQLLPATPADEALPPRNTAWRRFRRHRLAMLGAAIILILVLGSYAGPYLIPYNDTYIDIMQRFAPPFSGAHVLGTDELGRDMLARLMMGGRISLAVGFTAMLISMVIGISVGAIAGYYGGVVGSALMLRETGDHPAVLRERVTSPAGTTAAALRKLDDHGVRAAFLAALEAARDRSAELARD